MTATRRENALAALRREKPEYVPCASDYIANSPEMVAEWSRRTEKGEREFWEYLDVPFHYGEHSGQMGARDVAAVLDVEAYRPYLPELREDEWIHIWGNVWRKRGDNKYGDRVNAFPLENATSLKEFEEWPYFRAYETAKPFDPEDEFEGHKHWKRRDRVIHNCCGTLFEWTWMLRGFERSLLDLYEQPEIAEFMLDTFTRYAIDNVTYHAGTGSDIVILIDDVAMQSGMMMSPHMWRQWFKPRMSSIVEAARRAKEDIIVFYHSCGDCRAIVDDLIEIGIDILNPIQPECMDPVAFKKAFGNRITLYGTIGVQSTLSWQFSPEDVTRKTRRILDACKGNAGLVVAPAHTLEGVPYDNIMAMWDAAQEYGRYD